MRARTPSHHLLCEPELTRRVDELIDFLELRSHATVAVRTLSGGFQRRLAIALSLMNRPELLILTYIAVVSALLLLSARRSVHKRLTS